MRAHTQIFLYYRRTLALASNRHQASILRYQRRRKTKSGTTKRITCERKGERQKKNYEYVMCMVNRSSAAINYSRTLYCMCIRVWSELARFTVIWLGRELQYAHSLQSHISHWTLMQSNCYCKLICHCDMSRALATRWRGKEWGKVQEKKKK